METGLIEVFMNTVQISEWQAILNTSPKIHYQTIFFHLSYSVVLSVSLTAARLLPPTFFTKISYNTHYMHCRLLEIITYLLLQCNLSKRYHQICIQVAPRTPIDINISQYVAKNSKRIIDCTLTAEGGREKKILNQPKQLHNMCKEYRKTNNNKEDEEKKPTKR